MLRTKFFKSYWFYSVSLLLTIILPLIIWHLQLPIIESTYDGSSPNTFDSQPFEVFGFFVTILLVSITWLQIIKQSPKTLSKLVPIILPSLVFLNLLYTQIETFHTKSSDFLCYENAAISIVSGSNPYAGNPSCYLYPPLLAQSLSWLHQIVTYQPFAFTDSVKAWAAVYYLYQCAQFFQVVLAYYLTLLLCKNLRIKRLLASLLVAAIFLFNNPLVRTLVFEQVNLWILNSFLLGILLLKRYPLFGGMLVALGAHIKLYTLVLLLPWFSTKRWKSILGVIIGFVAIIMLQTNWLHDWTLWNQFVLYFRNPEKPTNYRNDSIWSLIFNLVKIPSKFLHTDILFKSVPIVVLILNILIAIWFVLRFIKREQTYKNITQNIDVTEKIWLNDVFRFYGNSIDAIAFSLLVSPSVWEHHYVLAIPIAVLAIASSWLTKPLLVSIGTFLVFCMPTFEIFPLSFHRLVGLLILVYLTSPTSTVDYFLNVKYKPLMMPHT